MQIILEYLCIVDMRCLRNAMSTMPHEGALSRLLLLSKNGCSSCTMNLSWSEKMSANACKQCIIASELLNVSKGRQTILDRHIIGVSRYSVDEDQTMLHLKLFSHSVQAGSTVRAVCSGASKPCWWQSLKKGWSWLLRLCIIIAPSTKLCILLKSCCKVNRCAPEEYESAGTGLR